MEILSRSDARIKTQAKYFTGIPCRRGHVCERYVSTGNCVKCLAPRRGMPKPPSAREQARHAQQPYYDSGAPCTRGHTSLRYVSTGNCIECLNNPRNGFMHVTLEGSMATIEQLLEYHAYLLQLQPSPLTMEHMTPGPRIAELNMQRHLKRRKLL